ncbi:hypothetical protein Leryth_011214 [Lithospermum erythrorhizon]|nr:hypothetical protein Leryth_011214 [Lithospermum erythrorhizon]
MFSLLSDGLIAFIVSEVSGLRLFEAIFLQSDNNLQALSVFLWETSSTTIVDPVLIHLSCNLSRSLTHYPSGSTGCGLQQNRRQLFAQQSAGFASMVVGDFFSDCEKQLNKFYIQKKNYLVVRHGASRRHTPLSCHRRFDQVSSSLQDAHATVL